MWADYWSGGGRGNKDMECPPGATQTVTAAERQPCDFVFEYRGQDVNLDICTWSVVLGRINIPVRRYVANTDPQPGVDNSQIYRQRANC